MCSIEILTQCSSKQNMSQPRRLNQFGQSKPVASEAATHMIHDSQNDNSYHPITLASLMLCMAYIFADLLDTIQF